MHRLIHAKMQQACGKNKLRLGEIKLLTHSSGYFSVTV